MLFGVTVLLYFIKILGGSRNCSQFYDVNREISGTLDRTTYEARLAQILNGDIKSFRIRSC